MFRSQEDQQQQQQQQHRQRRYFQLYQQQRTSDDDNFDVDIVVGDDENDRQQQQRREENDDNSSSSSNNEDRRRMLLTTQLGTLETVSSIGFGSLNLLSTTDDSSGTTTSNGIVDNVIQLLDKLPNNTLLDTAQIYGNGRTEEILGRAVAKIVSETDQTTTNKRFYWSTKFAPQLGFPLLDRNRNANAVVTKCYESMKKLQIEAIDLYQLHYSDNLTPTVQLKFLNDPCRDVQLWDGLIECYKLGLCKNVGVCNYGPSLLQDAYNYITVQHNIPLVSNQLSYNMMRYGRTKQTKQVADKLNITTLCYSPLMKGLLSGKYVYDDDETLPKGSQNRGKYYRFKSCLKRTQSLQTTLKELSNTIQKSPASISYKWILQQDNCLPIASIRNCNPNNVQQWNDLYDALDSNWSLSQEHMNLLTQLGEDVYDVSPTKEFTLL